jgi:Kef-type K+ transport system membrane component KefB
MDILYVLLVLLIATRLAAELAERLGQPALVGELVAGVLLGLAVHRWDRLFPVLSELTGSRVFDAVTDLGVFFLMLLAGLELRPRDIARASGKAALVAAGGMGLPLVLGCAYGWLALPDSPYKVAQSLFFGAALAITAVPVAVRVLMDTGAMETRAGRLIVAAALIDDVLSLLLLAVLTGVIRGGGMIGPWEAAVLVGKVVLFFAVATAVGRWVFPWAGRLLKASRADELELSMLLVGALAYAEMAEALGLHFILGAFFAGLFFLRRTVEPETHAAILGKVRGLTTGFLAPIFFASIGLHLELSALETIPGLVLVLILLATAGKVAGAGLGARLAGLSARESLVVGSAMNARGAVELIIADVALKAGLFDRPDPPPPEVAHVFSAVVIMAIATTIATPLLLKGLLRKPVR